MDIGRVLMIPTCWIVLLINIYPYKDQLYYLIQLCCSKKKNNSKITISDIQREFISDKNQNSENDSPIKKNNDIESKTDVSKTFNFIATVVILFGCSFIGWIYPNVVDWFSLTGALGGAFLNCYFPGKLFLAQFRQKPKSRA